jgi:signal transduction histidine kinase
MNSLESDEPVWGDLLAEIAEHCERMFQLNDTELTVTSSIAPDAPGIGVFRYVNIVRIFREAVANIVKHANAPSVQINISVTSDRFTLTVTDNGVGYDVTSVRKRGVANMYSRAGLLKGDLRIESPSSGGTLIMLTMPIGITEKEMSCV